MLQLIRCIRTIRSIRSRRTLATASALRRAAFATLAFTALALLGRFAADAQTATPPAETFRDALAARRLPLRLEAGRLAGDGAAALVAAARGARFVLVGEDHGIAETAELTAALFRALAPLGFDTYVTEVGPLSGERLSRLARDRRGAAAYDDLYRAYPFAIPFATYREEDDLQRAVAALSPRARPIAGIDQEFVLGPQWLLDDLARRASGKTRAALQALVARERASYRAIVATGNPAGSPLFMSQPLPAAWPAIRAHFAARRDRPALAALDALEASRTVYGYFFAGHPYDNNLSRSRLMKGYLRALLAPAAGSARERRLVIKLGATHVRRGFSPVHVADVGNLAAELADYRGESSLHLLALCLGGTQNAWRPFTPPEAKRVPLDLTADDYAPYRPLLDALPQGGGWAVYDLRPLRAQPWAQGAPDLAALLLGYDAVVTFDSCRASTLVPSLDPAPAASAGSVSLQ